MLTATRLSKKLIENSKTFCMLSPFPIPMEKLNFCGLSIFINVFFLYLWTNHHLNYFTTIMCSWLEFFFILNHMKGQSLTLQASHHCRSQTRSLTSAASCLRPASVRSMCTTSAPIFPAEPRSRPRSPSLESGPTGCFLLPPVAQCWSDAPAEFRELSSPPPVRSCGWRAAAGKSARWTDRSSSSPLDSDGWTQAGKTQVLLKRTGTWGGVEEAAEGAQVRVLMVFEELLQFTSNTHPPAAGSLP